MALVKLDQVQLMTQMVLLSFLNQYDFYSMPSLVRILLQV